LPNLKPESLSWLDNLAALEVQLEKTPSASHAELGKAIHLDRSMVTILSAIKPCFDPAAIEKVRLAAKGDSPYLFSYNKAKAFSGLGKANREVPSNEFHTALDIALSRRLLPKKIEALVDWMLKGNSPETFNESETGKKDKPVRLPSAAQGTPDDLTAQVMELAKAANEEKDRNDGKTIHRDKLKALLEKITVKAESGEDSEGKSSLKKTGIWSSKRTQKSKSKNNPSWLWESMVGIKFMNQLRSKAKKGELTNTDKILVILYRIFVEPFGSLFKHLGKLIGKMAIGFWHSVEEALGKTAKGILDFVLPILFIGLFIWGILALFHFAVVSPLHWIENKIGSVFHHGDVTSEPAAVPTPVPPTVRSEKLEVRNSNLKPKTPNSSLPTSNSPVVTYQPAVSFAPPASPAQTLSPQKPPGISSPAGTQYDLVTFETEIAAIPRNSIVKDYPLTPDETMPGDLAASRLQDLTNADKYTMKIGGDTQKIASVSSSNNTLMITFKSSDVFGNLVNGSNQPTFFWEDVNTVHINEISPQKNTGISSQSGTQDTSVYQCSLIVSGSKIPLTIQCARPEDLEHLVSTLEYFIRHSRLGHDAQPAGLPYPTQGLRFAGSENAVNLLWANSPADKAGLKLGDRLWSVGKVSNEQQSKDVFEKSLKTLPVTLFTVSPADWDEALVAKNNGSSKFFSPKLKKVIFNL
jgi:hypothetical protein